MTGAEIIAHAVQVAQAHGVYVHHNQFSLALLPGITRGFPDLVLLGDGGTLFREVKGSNDTPRVGQRRWGWRFEAAGLDFRVWTPADWASMSIDHEIARIARRAA